MVDQITGKRLVGTTVKALTTMFETVQQKLAVLDAEIIRMAAAGEKTDESERASSFHARKIDRPGAEVEVGRARHCGLRRGRGRGRLRASPTPDATPCKSQWASSLQDRKHQYAADKRNQKFLDAIEFLLKPETSHPLEAPSNFHLNRSLRNLQTTSEDFVIS